MRFRLCMTFYDHLQATFSPLIQASQDGHLGIVKVLVEYDSSPDHLDQRTTVSMLKTCRVCYNVASHPIM